MARSSKLPYEQVNGKRTSAVIAVNVGNTHVRWLAFEGDRTTAEGRCPTHEARQEPPPLPPGAIALVSVVPDAHAPWLQAWQAAGREVFVLDATHDLGLEIAYAQPLRLGADRLANALALWHGHGPGIVVDAGTATTLTVVDDTGVLRGGAILPGLTTARDALWRGTAQLPAVSLELPAEAIGNSTEGAIRAGVVLGQIGALQYLIQRMQAEAPSARTVLVTGGWGALMAPALPGAAYVPDLTLHGVRWAWLNAGR